MILGMKRIGKEFIRRQLEARGWEITRRTAGNGPSILALKLLIEHSLLVEGEGAILQVGANDGLVDDPIHEIIVARNLPAVLVEPLPDLFEQLQRNYAGRSNIYFENCAISTQPGEAEIFRISRAATHLPEWVHLLASFDKSVLLKHKDWPGVEGRSFEQHIESIRVPVFTVGQLLQKHSNVRKFIALQIDTEGHDFAVVKSAVKAGFLPTIINYEHKHLSYYDQVACRDLLFTNGYSFLSDGANTLAYKMKIA
ncbi:MAG: FkbM family methyltransferase [Methylovirgula sp.]